MAHRRRSGFAVQKQPELPHPGQAQQVRQEGFSAHLLVPRECLAVLADLTGNPDHQAGEREAILTLSALVGAISIARADDDPDLSEQIMANAATALKQSTLP